MSRCSTCSIKVKPVVAIDIDGTLTEYHDALRLHVEKYFALPPGQCGTYPWDGVGNFEDYLGITQAEYREAKLAFRQGGFKRWANPQLGLSDLLLTVKWLKESHDLEVWITTTRPWNRLDSVDPDTRFWLDRHFPVYDHLLYDDHKYLQLAELIDPDRVVLVLEDLADMHQEAAEAFGPYKAGLVRRPHNRTYLLDDWSSPVYDTLTTAAQSLRDKFK